MTGAARSSRGRCTHAIRCRQLRFLKQCALARASRNGESRTSGEKSATESPSPSRIRRLVRELCNARVRVGTRSGGRPNSISARPSVFEFSLSSLSASRRVMSGSGLTPVMEAAAAPASPTGAAGSTATPGVSLDFGPTSAPTTSAPGGLDLDSLDGLEPTPFEASASPGVLPAEALAPGGGYGAQVVDLLGLELDDSPAPARPPRPAARTRALRPTRPTSSGPSWRASPSLVWRRRR